VWVKNLEEIYTFDKKIGSGQYGKVLLVPVLKIQVWTAVDHISGKMVVCKIVERKIDYLRELDHLITLRSCYGVLPIKKAVFCTKKLCMEFDLAETSLYNFIKKRQIIDLGDYLYESLKIFYQLLISLDEMHINGIVHRDLKSTNIVMMKKNPWVIDLGMSKR
jgi:serine/threonine protein kinase